MKLLIAEDEAPKLNHLAEFSRRNLTSTISFARSVRAAIKAIQDDQPDLVLLDMSLPTFDVGADEPGGRPQGWGGAEVLRYLQFRRIRVPVIVVTQYEAFTTPGGTVDLSHLAEDLVSEHPDLFLGVVHYTALNEEWHSTLLDLVPSDLRSNP